MKIIKIVALVLLAVVLTMLGIIKYLDSQLWIESEFSTYKEAESSGIMEQGWIPPFIPESSINIKEEHYLDTSEVIMSFEYTSGDVEKTRSACSSEKMIAGGIELECDYQSKTITIKLLDNGKATLNSQRNYSKTGS